MQNLTEKEKIELIEEGLFHSELLDDLSVRVRIAIAKVTDDLGVINKLRDSEDWEVRFEIASRFPELVWVDYLDDPDWRVRRMLVDCEFSYVLNELRYDKNWSVRYAICQLGREEDAYLFLNDKSPEIRELAASLHIESKLA